jgi:hypothetical protein
LVSEALAGNALESVAIVGTPGVPLGYRKSESRAAKSVRTGDHHVHANAKAKTGFEYVLVLNRIDEPTVPR